MNLLGTRQTEIYGEIFWSETKDRLEILANEFNYKLLFFQSNYEGAIVDFIQKNLKVFDGIIINPAGFSKTGYSILDAMDAMYIPYIEVHYSNIFERGGWHAESIFLEHAKGHIIGLKNYVYELALRGMREYLQMVKLANDKITNL